MTKIICLFYLQLITISYNIICLAALAYREEVANGGSPGNPGVQTTLSEKGIIYINRVAGDIINVAIPTMTIPDISQNIPLGYVDLTDLHIINFRPADEYNIYLKRPNIATWTLTNMDIGMTGHANGKYLLTKFDGNFDMTEYNLNFDITLAVTNNNGRPHIDVMECEARSKSMDLDIYDFRRNLVRIFENHKKLVINIIKPKVERELCKQLKTFLEKNANNEIQQMPMKMPLDKNQYSLADGTRFADSSSSSSSTLTNSRSVTKTELMMREMLSKLFFDYSLTRDPQFEPNRADFYSKGEISYMGNGNTPFYPNPRWSDWTSKTDRMAYVTVSDYAINSLTYHAYQNNLLNFKINKRDNPDFAVIFKPSCNELEGEICLNSFLPELNERYPNYDIEVQTIPTQAPAIIVRNGKAFAYTVGELIIKAMRVSENIEVVRIAFNAEAEMKPYLENSMVKGNTKINKLELKLLRSTIKEFDQKRVNVLQDMMKIVLDVIVNALVSKGFPLPTIKEVRLINPKLTLLDRNCLIETDMEINKDAVAKLAQKMAAQMASPSMNNYPQGSLGSRRRIG